MANVEEIIYFSYLIISIIKKKSKLNNKSPSISIKQNLYLIFDYVFKINTIEKAYFLFILIMLFLVNILPLGRIVNFIVVITILFLFTEILISILKQMKSISRLLIGQMVMPLIAFIYFVEFFIVEMVDETLNMSSYFIMLILLIFWQYTSIKVYYIERRKLFRILNLVTSYINIIITSVLLFILIGYGFIIYNPNFNDIGSSKAILNISENEKVLNFLLAMIAYGIDNLTSDIGIKVMHENKSQVVNIYKVIFSLVSKAFVSIYAVLILAFLSNSLFNRNSIKENE